MRRANPQLICPCLHVALSSHNASCRSGSPGENQVALLCDGYSASGVWPPTVLKSTFMACLTQH